MKRKYPRLANGFGSIKYLGKGRSKPYAVYPPEYTVTEKGNMNYRRALCYVPDWYTGFAVLVAYKAGTYRTGDELKMAGKLQDIQTIDEVARRILDDYKVIGRSKEEYRDQRKHKLKDVFDEYYDFRFGEYAYDVYAPGTEKQYKSNWKRWSLIHERYIEDLKTDQIQDVVNGMSTELSHNSVKLCVRVLKNVISYAIQREYIVRDPVNGVRIPMIAKAEEHAIPYTAEELAKVWKAAYQGDETAISVIIQCYSGFRVSAYKTMKVDLTHRTMTGGVKSRDGSVRTVPIHSAIYPFVFARMKTHGKLSLYDSRDKINRDIAEMCKNLRIPVHTTHSARHTFKMLCDRYGVNPVASRILMGHSLKTADVHDAVYSHYETEDLRREIEKIVVDLLPIKQ